MSSDRVAVMYLGKIVEIGDRDDLYDRPRHPYTVAMLSAVPVPDTKRRHQRERIRLVGDVPSPINPPPACRFHTRCWKAQEICRTEEPQLLQIGSAPRGQRAPRGLPLPRRAGGLADPGLGAPAAPRTPLPGAGEMGRLPPGARRTA